MLIRPPANAANITLAGDVTGAANANVIAPGVVTGGVGGMLAAGTVTGGAGGNLGAGTVTGGVGGNLGSGTVTGSNLASSTVAQGNLADPAQPWNNQLTNPGFNFAQLQTPGTLTTISDNSVGPDAWKVTRENNDVQYQRVSNAGSASYNSANRGRFKKITNAGKVMVYQPMESFASLGLQNQQVTFTIRINLSAAHPIRIGLFVFTGASPNNAVSAPVSAWNGANIIPTFNAGFTVVNSFAFNAGVGLSVSSVTQTVPTIGANDILCAFVVSDDQLAINDYFDLYETSLDIGSSGRVTWKPLSEAEDTARVERFIEKSYDIDTIPGTATLTSSSGQAQVGASCLFDLRYRQRKILSGGPAITLYSPVTGASGNFADITTAADVVVGTADIGLDAADITSAAASDNDRLKGHWLINGSL